jgi:hypothetical protein
MSRTRKPEVVGVKIRLATELVSRLETAAKKRKVSFNHEAASRLGKSFAEEDAFGGEEGRRLLYFIASAFLLGGRGASGGREISQWINEPKAYAAAMFGVLEALMVAQPGVSLETCELQIKSLRGRIATRLLAQGGLAL